VEAQCYLPVTILALVRGVAANLCLRTRVKVPKPDHRYTFFGAKTAAMFSQLNAGLLKMRFDPAAAPGLSSAERNSANHQPREISLAIEAGCF
jgi:hypothetical protein